MKFSAGFVADMLADVLMGGKWYRAVYEEFVYVSTTPVMNTEGIAATCFYHFYIVFHERLSLSVLTT